MRLVAKHTPTTIQSFSIGGHPYESFFDFWKTTRSEQNYVHRPFNPPAIPYEPDWTEEIEAAETVFAKLQHLRLPIKFQWRDIPDMFLDISFRISDTFLSRMLECSSPNLVRLSLSSLDLLYLHRSGRTGVRSHGRRCLEFLLFPLSFGALEHLELQCWPLPRRAACQEFLLKHSSTLKELRLLRCVVSEDPRSLGRWAGKNMCLSGVDMDLTEEDADETDSQGQHYWGNSDLQGLWLAGRPNSLSHALQQ
jgi:hypothetical protein